jgi:hypothetical protein
MGDIPLVPLSFIAGPAILANACAIMQNGASIRYNLAVQHLREFRTSIAAQDTKRTILYDDPRKAGGLSETRVLVLLRELGAALGRSVAVCASQPDGGWELDTR